MSEQTKAQILTQLDKILEAELSGVVRYLHYSFMIFGPNRIPITGWFRDHANEGILPSKLSRSQKPITIMCWTF
jgi:bacterioferritin